MEGHVQVEAHGFGIRLRTAVLLEKVPMQPPTGSFWQRTVGDVPFITPGFADRN